MTKQEYLEILRRGAKTWNRWREEHPHIQPNLTGADLSGFNLEGANLRDVILLGAALTPRTEYVTFGEAYGYGGDHTLAGTVTRNVNLSGSDLQRANLSLADLSEANLSGADLSGANLSRTILVGTNLTNA